MFGPDPALLEDARQVARTIDYEPFYDLMVPVPGLFDVLATLRPSWRLGMATNRGSTVPEVVRRFGLDAWLDAAVGVLDVARPKPQPDVILECLARLAVPPGRRSTWATRRATSPRRRRQACTSSPSASTPRARATSATCARCPRCSTVSRWSGVRPREAP